MRSLQSSRHLLLAGAWLATIAITYCFGRLGDPAAVHTPSPASSNSGTAAPHASDAQPLASASVFLPLESHSAKGQRTIEAVTGGQPLDDWLKRLLNQDDEIIRTTAFLQLLEALEKPEDLRQALEIIAANGGGNRWRGNGMREASMLLQKWSQLDPKGAIAYAESLKGGDDRGMAANVVLRTWARSNPEEAIAYAQANGQSTNPQDGNWSLASVVAQLARTDIDRALQVAGTQDMSRARGRMMDSLLSELVTQRGEESARATILALPPGSFRDNLTAQLAGRLADSDGAGTAQWVMNTLPAGDARSRALAEVVNQWAGDDPVAAGNFLSRLPSTPETDPARERYAYDVLRRDPEGALAWANTITAGEQRTRAIENLVRAWMRRDRTAAQNWVASANLPENVRNQLLRN
ncbi:hypothetical protein ACXR0O_17780 [Verrucomicrobiota bacterium sgz303538]